MTGDPILVRLDRAERWRLIAIAAVHHLRGDGKRDPREVCAECDRLLLEEYDEETQR